MAFPRKPDQKRLLKMVGLSLVVHFLVVVILSLNPWPSIIKAHPIVYTVTLMPVPPPPPEVQKAPPPPPPKEKASKPAESSKTPPPKPVEKPKKDDIVEKIKKIPPKIEKPEEKKVDLRNLQEAIDEVRKKAAIDEIQRRVARREKEEEKPVPIPPTPPTLPSIPPTPPPVSPTLPPIPPTPPPVPPTLPPIPPTPPLTPPPTKTTPTVPVASPPKPSSQLQSKMDEYYSMIWAKIKESWTIPENLLKEMVDLETIIVIIIDRDGKLRKVWFEKKSGNALYDQMAMRALKKAEPLPPIPKELSESTLEIGIRFTPD